MKNEIYEIPYRAQLCYSKNKGIILPENVPYVGMGSSYIATRVFNYLGITIFPEISSEFYNYIGNFSNEENGVLISQSGQSIETIKCADKFKSFVAIVNNNESPLSTHNNCAKSFCIFAGNEDLLPSKTYINTLVILYLGLGFDPGIAISMMKDELFQLEEQGLAIGNLIFKQIKRKRNNGIYIIGNGPNVATAGHAAMVLSQATKTPVSSMSVAQYYHGFKETAKNSLVIAINPNGPEYDLTKKIMQKLENAGAFVLDLNISGIEEKLTPLIFPIHFFFASEFLATKLKISNPFLIGGKITKTDF